MTCCICRKWQPMYVALLLLLVQLLSACNLCFPQHLRGLALSSSGVEVSCIQEVHL